MSSFLLCACEGSTGMQAANPELSIEVPALTCLPNAPSRVLMAMRSCPGLWPHARWSRRGRQVGPSVAGLTGDRTADWDFPPTRRRAGDTGLCRFHVAEAEIKRVSEGSLGGKDSNAM